MRVKSLVQFLLALAAASILAACGASSDSSGSDGAAGPVLQQGKAVDPYISGAVFKEMTRDGKVLQRESTPSDAQGNFSFPRPVSEGSILEMKVEGRGYHNGAPYKGVLRRLVEAGEEGVLVVSPLTTLVANGASPQEVLSFLAEAGMPGMMAADINADPMAGLEHLLPGEVTDEQLRTLRAAMAVNTFLHLLNDYRAGAMELASPVNRQIMADLVQATREILNAASFEKLAADLADDPDLAGHPMLLGDTIRAAAACMQRIGELADNGALPSRQTIRHAVQDALAGADGSTREYLLSRVAATLPAANPESDSQIKADAPR